MKKLSDKAEEALNRIRREKELPHLHHFKWYPWALKFFESTNRFNFLCAANQSGKSTTQIRKAIHWATEKSLWPELWPHSTPRQFAYLYPTKTVGTIEFNEKWVPEILPRNKKCPIYGWEEEVKNKEIWAIHFNSGVSIYFKTYAQDVQDLQTFTAYAIFADEELPFQLFNELRARLTATNGHFHMVFTATLGQDEWRRTMDPNSDSEELFKNALKITASLHDCLKYTDGTNSFWTSERIKEVELSCSSEAEIQKRVNGRFVVSSGLKFPGFNRIRNLVPRQDIDRSWSVYSGTDIGTGGEKGHPAAHVFVALRPDCKLGIVFKAWRGDGIVTSSSDILEKYKDLCTSEIVSSSGEIRKVRINPVIKSYDWNAKDFFIVANRSGEGFTQADKRRDAGAGVINTLFKMGMLVILDDDPELQKLVVELTSLQENASKIHAKDNLCDALRYAVMPMPWNFEGVAGEILKEEEKHVDTRSEVQKHYDERKSGNLPDKSEEGQSLQDEFDEWNSYLGN